MTFLTDLTTLDMAVRRERWRNVSSGIYEVEQRVVRGKRGSRGAVGEVGGREFAEVREWGGGGLCERELYWVPTPAL